MLLYICSFGDSTSVYMCYVIFFNVLLGIFIIIATVIIMMMLINVELDLCEVKSCQISCLYIKFYSRKSGSIWFVL